MALAILRHLLHLNEWPSLAIPGLGRTYEFNDYVEIFELSGGRQHQLGKYNNKYKPKLLDNIVSEGLAVKVIFKSDNWYRYKGFKMAYEWNNKGNYRWLQDCTSHT